MNYSFTCIIIDDDLTHLAELTEAIGALPGVRLQRTYTSLTEGLAFLQSSPQPVDIVFCDIMLLDANGLDYGPQLSGGCKLLVYVTGYPHLEKAVLEALGDDCLIKPVSTAVIQSRAIGRLLKRYGDELPLRIRFNKLLMYNGTTKKTEEALIKDVAIITHDDNYLDIFTGIGETQYTVRSTVAEAIALLEPYGVFIQINRSTIVNANFVDDFSPTSVQVDEKNYKVTAAYRDDVVAFLRAHTLGKRGGR